MFNLFNFLLDVTKNDINNILEPITSIIKVVVPSLLLLVGSIGSIWCIILGVKYAKAEDPQEHEKAKKSLINAIVGFVLIFVLLVMLNVATEVFTTYYTDSLKSPGAGTGAFLR